MSAMNLAARCVAALGGGDSKGRLFVWRIGTDHSICELERLFKEYQTEAGNE
jgi:hypothetical protein